MAHKAAPDPLPRSMKDALAVLSVLKQTRIRFGS